MRTRLSSRRSSASVTAEIVLLEQWQTPTGRALVIKPETGIKEAHAHPYVYVLSECCRAEINADWNRAHCKACDEQLVGKFEFSSSFPVGAFNMTRPHGYWWPWGKSWFGWDEFSFEVME